MDNLRKHNNSIDFFKGTIIFLNNFFIKFLGDSFKEL